MKPGTVIKTWTTKKGNRALIRVVKPADLLPMHAYANAIAKEDIYVMLTEPITLSDEKKYLDDALKKVRINKKIHLIVEVNGKFAGSCEVRVGDKRKAHVGEVGISLASPYREEGIGTECMKTLIGQSRKLGLKLLYLHCFENNFRAHRTYEKAGFIRAGTVPDMYSYKGKYIGEATFYLKLA